VIGEDGRQGHLQMVDVGDGGEGGGEQHQAGVGGGRRGAPERTVVSGFGPPFRREPGTNETREGYDREEGGGMSRRATRAGVGDRMPSVAQRSESGSEGIQARSASDGTLYPRSASAGIQARSASEGTLYPRSASAGIQARSASEGTLYPRAGASGLTHFGLP